jgi:site-specific DNA recombinase
VLLSFAQFEREVTAERIRDKIAASKKKGMWMGGMVPWGYQVHSDPKVQSLEPHPQNAPDIQRVFDLYERVGCLSKLKREVDQLWPNRSYSRGRLHNILRNPIYIGKVRHKSDVYEGLHEAIIAQEQFNRVQQQMQLKSVIKRGTHHSRGPSAFLVGKVFDEIGDRLTPSKTRKNGRSIRYYYSNRLITKGADPTGWRLRADMMEKALNNIVRQQLTKTLQRMQITPLMKPHEVTTALQVIDALDIRQTLELIAHVDLSEAVLIIKLNHKTLVNHLGINSDDLDHDYLSFEQPVTFQRRSNGTKMVWANYKSEPNHALIRAIVQSRSWVEKLKAGKSVSDITASEGISEGRLWKRIRLAFLSPTLVTAILDGTTNQELTINKLSAKDIPLNWEEQQAQFLC